MYSETDVIAMVQAAWDLAILKRYPALVRLPDLKDALSKVFELMQDETK